MLHALRDCVVFGAPLMDGVGIDRVLLRGVGAESANLFGNATHVALRPAWAHFNLDVPHKHA